MNGGGDPLDALSGQDKLPQSMQGLSEGTVAAPGQQMVAALTDDSQETTSKS